ncbi:uncharacterized protein UTRI_04039_B [Ustilago trichophora]|uniref:UDENN domain-containing protein n=1 Tax=Ustilago trichophora TaxID=86804 RepID=A0A5C3E867_9BASI|nr:uncharacterized protein UTRI_04039_B [Ustilago trichophora]
MSISDARDDAAATNISNSYCTFCMLAEFDIDRGSTLSHQYPAPTGYDEHMLAELMLPDGVHARSEDWTFFFLKPPGARRTALRDTADEGGSSQPNTSTDPSSWLSHDLTYVINLVRTKHDNTVRRGAMVKAMAIGTRYPFIEIFKPALLLALDDYFKEPGPDYLARLYESINRLDLSAAPSFSRAEKLVLRASDRRDLFEERFVAAARTDVEAAATASGALPTTPSEEIETARSSPIGVGGVEMTRRRTDSTSTFSSETRSLKKKLSAASLRPALGARRGSSANSIVGVAGVQDRRSNLHSASPLPGSARPRDTHFFDTVLTYRSVPLPIRVPLTTFPEEVGEYSLIRLIQTFSGPQSAPSGPIHPHLHTNGPSTHPIIVLFNALVTQKRVIFLGYGQPANQVAGYVLAACALGSGCGVVLQGFAARAFPYTNLLNLDDLEKVPGYIAGVTNPRFEDLHAWDLLLNVETGRIQVAKDIAAATPPASVPTQSIMRAATMPRDGAGVTSSNTFGSVSSATGHEMKPTPENELAQFGALPTNTSGAVGSVPVASKSSSMGGAASRDRSNTTQYDSRSDATNALFMEELQTAIAAHYGERFIRSRVQEYVFLFVQRVARHEEHFYGRTSLVPHCQPFLNGQLGSGPVYVDRESEMREILSNQMRIEGFRSTIAYNLLVEELQKYGGYTHAIRNFDIAHQIGRLRRARKLHVGESDLIFETIAKSVTSHDQIVEVLALLPPHTGGLLPLALGLFHPSQAARDAVVDFFLRLCRHPVGRKFVQSMHTYQRLAFARLAQDRAEVEMTKSANEVQELSIRSSSNAPPSSSLLSSHTVDTDSLGEVRSPTARASSSSTMAPPIEAEQSVGDASKASTDEPAYMAGLRGMSHPFKSFSPQKENARKADAASTAQNQVEA